MDGAALPNARRPAAMRGYSCLGVLSWTAWDRWT